jgi:hypothetical protein
MPRMATGSPCTAAHRTANVVGHVDGGGLFGGTSTNTAGSVRGGDALRLAPRAVLMPRPRPSTGERDA